MCLKNKSATLCDLLSYQKIAAFKENLKLKCFMQRLLLQSHHSAWPQVYLMAFYQSDNTHRRFRITLAVNRLKWSLFIISH